MNAINRYLMRQIALAMVTITLALTLAIWLAYSLRFVDYIVSRGLPLDTFLYFVALLLPKFLGIVLPIALFSAVTFTFHRLNGDSELVVLRATGLSDLKLAQSALIVAAVVTLIVYALNLHFRPAAARSFKELQVAIRNDHSSVLVQPGVFTSFQENMTFYVREQGDDGTLHGILLHDNRDQKKAITVMAERGAIAPAKDGPRIVLVHGNRQEVDRSTGKLSLLYFERYTVDLGALNDSFSERWRESRERSLGELLEAKAEDVGVQNVASFRAEAHERLSSPLLTLTFAGLALVIVLHGDFNRRGQTKRILIAVAAALAVQALALGLRQLSVKVPALLPSLYVNALAPLAASLWFLMRPMRARPRGPMPAPAE